MIYATMCVGDKWILKHKNSLNNFGKNNRLFVLSDNVTQFSNCNTHLYTRNIFSYYEKINFIIELLEKYKERITYIDADWIEHYNTNNTYDSDSLYTYQIFNLNEPPLSDLFKKTESNIIKNLFSKIDLKKSQDWYIPEAIISFPYRVDIDSIKKDFNILQPHLEKIYNDVPIRDTLHRYSEVGIGYGEGWALTAISLKYNIEVKDFKNFPNRTWRKVGLI